MKDYRVVARDSGASMYLDLADWNMLLRLASEYGYEADQDLFMNPASLYASETEKLARALVKAVEELPENRPPPLGTGTGQFLDTVGFWDPKKYFSGKRRWIVGEFIGLCNEGDLQVRKTTT